MYARPTEYVSVQHNAIRRHDHVVCITRPNVKKHVRKKKKLNN